MNLRMRWLLLVWLIGLGDMVQAQSNAPAWSQSNFLDRWLLHTRWRPRVATGTLQLRGDIPRSGQVVFANQQGFAWMPNHNLQPKSTQWQWVSPETVQSLSLKRSIPFGTHLRRVGRMTFYGVWGTNVLVGLDDEHYAGWGIGDDGTIFSLFGGMVGLGAGLATVLITEMTTWSKYRFQPEIAEAATRAYGSVWRRLSRISLHRAGDSTSLGEPPFWELRRAGKRWSVAIEAGHMIDSDRISYYNDRSLTFTATGGPTDKEWIRTGPYYPSTQWYTLSLGYMLRPAWQVGLRYAFPMEANAPWSTFNPPVEGNASWSVHRKSQFGLWSAVEVLPPKLFPLLRTRVQVGGGYFFQPLTVEQSITIEGRRQEVSPYQLEAWNLYTEQQTRQWLHGLEGFIRLRQELCEHIALTVTLRRQWVPRRTQADPLTLRVPSELVFPVEQFMLSPHEVQHNATFLTPGIEVRW